MFNVDVLYRWILNSFHVVNGYQISQTQSNSEYISSKFSSDSEAFASESLENLEEMFLRCL